MRNDTTKITAGTSYEQIDTTYMGKPLACGSAIREIINGKETRVHDGFGQMIKPSTYPEANPRPATTWTTGRQK